MAQKGETKSRDTDQSTALKNMNTSRVDMLSSNRSLVESELLRKKLYENVLETTKNWLHERNPYLKWNDRKIAHLLLRYIFNKKATAPETDSEPIFLRNKCGLARSQLRRDFETERMADADELADVIDHELIMCYREFRFKKVGEDEEVMMDSTQGCLEYKGHKQKDFADLAKKYGPKYYHAAYALGLRYSYVNLEGHGLSRDYETDTKRKSNDENACECFCSAFNHFFDRYYSAFPDLESCFGSRGSFFYIKWGEEPDNMNYYICPPFDETLMLRCVQNVLDALENQLVRNATFIFSIPGSWADFKALEELKKCRWLKKSTDYTKGNLSFINYMARSEKDRLIYPTDICELILSNIKD